MYIQVRVSVNDQIISSRSVAAASAEPKSDLCKKWDYKSLHVITEKINLQLEIISVTHIMPLVIEYKHIYGSEENDSFFTGENKAACIGSHCGVMRMWRTSGLNEISSWTQQPQVGKGMKRINLPQGQI